MRFTIKAKLATAFGVIIALSMTAGGIAFYQLSELDRSQQAIIAQGERAGKVADLQRDLQAQVRAEKNVMLASEDKDIEAAAADLQAARQRVQTISAEMYASASEQGKRLMDQVNAKSKTLNDIQNETLRLARLNSANRAEDLWRAEGTPALSAQNATIDSLLGELDKSSGSYEHEHAARIAMVLRFEVARSLRMLIENFTAAKPAELEQRRRAMIGQIDSVKRAVAAAATALKSVGISAEVLEAQAAQVQAVMVRALDVANEGGTIKAIELSKGDGRKALVEALAAYDAYGDFIEKRMKDLGVEGTNTASVAKTLLAAIVMASLLIAVAAAFWIALNISRGVAGAVSIANAVAAGDLTKTATVQSDDEVGDLITALNDTVEKLRDVVSQVNTAAENMSAGSQELSASAEQLSQGSTEQASSTEEASSSMEEMAANVKQNAENAATTEKMAGQSAK
ncbi:HAMP domain-containing methyl-accepting chemotaxis protein, partial [Bosea psychrotolerans]